MRNKVLFILISILILGCEPTNNILSDSKEKNELKAEQFLLDYEGCTIHGKLILSTNVTRGVSDNDKIYDLVLTSEYLKTPIVTQLVQTFSPNGCYTLAHIVEGIKVATLYYDAEGKLSDIKVEEYPTTRVQSNFLGCFNSEYSSMKKQYQSAVGEFVADMTENVVAPSLAATAAAKCSGMFDYVGIK